MIFDLSSAEEKLGYTFKDTMLLRQCFTHASYAHENRYSSGNNEVLEFFGDAILEFVVTEYLCENVDGDEGKLTELRKRFVSKEPLQRAVFELGLDCYMLLGVGERKSTGRNEKMYSSLFEAIVAGIYYDGGLAAAKKFILEKLIRPTEAALAEKKDKKKIKAEKNKKDKDPKSAFQEYVQKSKLGEIVYEEISRTGPDHAPKFEVALNLGGKRVSTGNGGSKKAAESAAASVALKKLKKSGILK